MEEHRGPDRRGWSGPRIARRGMTRPPPAPGARRPLRPPRDGATGQWPTTGTADERHGAYGRTRRGRCQATARLLRSRRPGNPSTTSLRTALPQPRTVRYGQHRLVRCVHRRRPPGGRQRRQSGPEGDRPAIRLQGHPLHHRLRPREGRDPAERGRRVPDGGAARRAPGPADQAGRTGQESPDRRSRPLDRPVGAPHRRPHARDRRRHRQEDRQGDQGRRLQEGAGLHPG